MATLKQSTAYTRMFLLVESSDHVTGLTGATAAVSLSKAGGSFASAGGTVTEVSDGWYKIALTTTDTATLGDLAFHITATSADPTDFVDQVTANILGDAYARLGAPVGASISADVAGVPTALLTASDGVETGYTVKAALRLMFSVLCGKSSGLPGSPVFRDVPDTKARVSATTDSNGNRSAITLDAT